MEMQIKIALNHLLQLPFAASVVEIDCKSGCIKTPMACSKNIVVAL